MSELKKDDVWTTGDELRRGGGSKANGEGERAGGVVAAEDGEDDNATAESKGTIGTGEEDTSLTQASGGSVD
jgi:hypothetical protein